MYIVQSTWLEYWRKDLMILALRVRIPLWDVFWMRQRVLSIRIKFAAQLKNCSCGFNKILMKLESPTQVNMEK